MNDSLTEDQMNVLWVVKVYAMGLQNVKPRKALRRLLSGNSRGMGDRRFRETAASLAREGVGTTRDGYFYIITADEANVCARELDAKVKTMNDRADIYRMIRDNIRGQRNMREFVGEGMGAALGND